MNLGEEFSDDNSELKLTVEDENVHVSHKIANKEYLWLSVFSALSISLSAIFYKMAVSMNGSDNSVFRYLIQLISMICVLKYKNIPLLGPSDQLKLLLARSFFGIFAVVFTNFSLKYIEPSNSIVLSHTNIIITAIMSRMFLREKLGVQHLIAILMSLTGIVFILKPSFLFHEQMPKELSNEAISNDYRLIGTVFAIAGAFGSGAIHIIIKKLCINNVHFGVTTLYGTFMGLPISILTSMILVALGVDHKNFMYELQYLPYDILFGLIGGSLAVLAHVLFNISLKYEDATDVAIVRTCDVFFSFILQFLILNINFDLISIIGAAFIIIGTLAILVFKKINGNI
jgi:drug/metabolite transporter (DMT)-like permease